MKKKNTNTHTVVYEKDIAGSRVPYTEIIQVRETAKFYIGRNGAKFSKMTGARRDASRDFWRGELIKIETLRPIDKA